MDKNKLYQSKYDAYVKENPTKSGKDCQENVIKKWNEIKMIPICHQNVITCLTQFKAVAMQKKENL